MCLLFLHFAPLLGGAVGKTPGSILNLDILLGAGEDGPHLGDLVFHQMFVEGVGDLHPTDERDDNHFAITVIHHSHLALEIMNILFEAHLRLHLDGEEVIVVLP